jgi:uncharacterized damage-inducible protein DinB
MIEHFGRSFVHAAWANRRLLPLVEAAAETDHWPRIFHHVLAAERIWLGRLEGRADPGLEVWPRFSPAECRVLIDANADGYRQFLARTAERSLGDEVAYVNARGEGYVNTVADILTHVAMHGSYHRGQIAAAVRAGGGVPVSTDFIRFARESTA